MRTTLIRSLSCVGLAVLASGCGDVARLGRSPVQVTTILLQAAPGSNPSQFGNPLLSDVETLLTTPAPCTPQAPCATFFNDLGQITMALLLKNPGSVASPNAPSLLNQVTFTRYRVEYTRTDGRNVQGVDVPFAFDSAVTFTVSAGGTSTNGFELVRNIAKREAPLLALRTSGVIISTIAEVTFYGKDQTGSEVTASGRMAVNFGNFADQ